MHWLEQRFKDLFPTELGTSAGAKGTDSGPGATPAELDRYVAAAVRGVLDDLRKATEGERNTVLNASAYRLGRFVSGANLDEGAAYAWLEHVAREIGLETGETGRTIRSGLDAGKADPFTLAGNDYRTSPATAGLEYVDHEDQDHAGAELPRPLDWSIVLSDETPDVDWLIPDLIERGRLHALFAPSKSHKSLIVQYLCAELAQSEPVVYLDFENSRADLKLRFGPRGMDRSAADLANLLYFQFPGLSALDTAAGGAQLEAMAAEYRPALVIIDTTSRVIRGGENDSDTFRALYRHALVRLKALGIAVLRIDHAGKDVALGQRGSSAKSDDVDTVWLLVKQGDETFSLRCTHQRSGNHPELVTLHKRLDPLRFERLDGVAHVGRKLTTVELAKELDRLGLPLDVGRDRAYPVLAASGVRVTKRETLAAIQYRQETVEREKEAAALTLDVSDLASSPASSSTLEQDQPWSVHRPVHEEGRSETSPGQAPVHGASSTGQAVNRGVPEGASSPTGGPVRPPVNWPPDTEPPDRPPGQTYVDKEQRQAMDALVKGGIKLRIVRQP